MLIEKRTQSAYIMYLMTEVKITLGERNTEIGFRRERERKCGGLAVARAAENGE
jgi:hypothetical protein